MLVYEKKVNDTRHLYAASNNIPADNDSQLSYKDELDQPVSVSFSDQLFDDGKGGMKKLDGTVVNAWANDINIIPGGLTPINKSMQEVSPIFMNEPEPIIEEVKEKEEEIKEEDIDEEEKESPEEE